MKIVRQEISHFGFLVFILFFVWGIHYSYTPVYAAEKELPPRGISVAPEYTGIIVQQGEDVSVDVVVTNFGRQAEDIGLSLTSVPKGWTAWIKTYSYGVTGVHVESDKSKSLTLRVEQKGDIEPGQYTLTMKGQTADGKLTSTSHVVIVVKEKEKEKKPKGVNITTSYPVLQGPTDAKFEFSLEVESKIEKDTIFNLVAQGPKDWEINFKPAYEEKYISSLRIKSDRSETMAVSVKPYPLAQPGKYPIKVKISAEKAEAEVELMVVLTGTYKIEAGTADGLLSLNAMQGRKANLSFYVKNTGSATQNNVKFLSFKPENWKVEFKPEKFEMIAPGELKQIEAIITPAEQALVGDYSVTLTVEGEKASKNMELRVTVKASTVWGWIGIGIIVIVIAGLVTLFVKMGRR